MITVSTDQPDQPDPPAPIAGLTISLSLPASIALHRLLGRMAGAPGGHLMLLYYALDEALLKRVPDLKTQPTYLDELLPNRIDCTGDFYEKYHWDYARNRWARKDGKDGQDSKDSHNGSDDD